MINILNFLRQTSYLIFQIPTNDETFFTYLYIFEIKDKAIRPFFFRYNIDMKRFFYIITLLTTLTTNALAQERRVQNRPYTDLRKFHFGVLVGTHLQDIEFENIGSQVVTFENGSTSETLITCDQDRWDGGFNVGVLGELRLNSNFAFRVAPAMYFGARHLTFRNLRNIEAEGLLPPRSI